MARQEFFKKMTADERFEDIKRILILTLVLNWAVAGAKIVYGLMTRFTSMAADGFHSLSDGASNILGLIGISIACWPADKDHPYGHRKYETLFSLGIAGLLFFVCFNLISEGIRYISAPRYPQIGIITLLVMVVTMSINLLVMRYEYKEGKRLNSDVLISDSMHTKADIFTSFSVILAMIAVKLGYPIIDPFITIIISLFIAYMAISIVRQGAGVLCDTAAILDDKKIVNIVLGIEGVRACHKIRTRGRVDAVYVDLHVQMNPAMHIDKAHQISYKIESAIKQGIPGVADVVVHVEPQEN